MILKNVIEIRYIVFKSWLSNRFYILLLEAVIAPVPKPVSKALNTYAAR